MLTRFLRAELCFILHTASVSGLCVIVVGLMRLAIFARGCLAA